MTRPRPSPYTTLVSGTDGSPTSLTAVGRAASAAVDSGAELVLVCAYYPTSARDQAARATGVLGRHPVTDRDAAEILARARETALAAGLPAEPETRAVAAHPGEALAGVAADREADVIVVGDRGLSGVAGPVLGSVPHHVMRHAPCDVLVVHTTGSS